MKKLIPSILLSPFLIISIYWAIEKYIYFMFDIKDEMGAGVVTVTLTMGVVMGIAALIINKVIK
jgi:hypothetical protein